MHTENIADRPRPKAPSRERLIPLELIRWEDCVTTESFVEAFAHRTAWALPFGCPERARRIANRAVEIVEANHPTPPPAPRLMDEMLFCRKWTRAEKKDLGLSGFNYWDVASSGDYGVDCEIGGRFGREYLRFLAAHPNVGSRSILPLIIGDMIRAAGGDDRNCGIRLGFLLEVGNMACLGGLLAEGGLERQKQVKARPTQ